MARKAKGLGDVIDNITTATGIKAATKAIFGEHCGCEERREYLNSLFPFGAKPKRWLNATEAAFWVTFRDRPQKNKISPDEARTIAQMHAEVFGHKLHVPCTCNAKQWAKWIEEIETVYNQ